MIPIIHGKIFWIQKTINYQDYLESVYDMVESEYASDERDFHRKHIKTICDGLERDGQPILQRNHNLAADMAAEGGKSRRKSRKSKRRKSKRRKTKKCY